MTAEIAILNRSGIALAADSAVTLGGKTASSKKRVYKSTNKIFSLSPENDIGIMIFGSADYCGVPWETIIKLFSQKKNVRFNRVSECKEEFIEFVRGFETENNAIKFLNVNYIVMTVVEQIMGSQSTAETKTDKKSSVNKMIEYFQRFCEDFEIWDTETNQEDFKAKYGDLVRDVVSESSEFKVSKPITDNIIKCCFEVYRRNVPSDLESGIVFAGFGEAEYFPCLSAVTVDGLGPFGLRVWEHKTGVGMENWNESNAFIIPFAQKDIAHLFIEGIEEEYVGFLRDSMLAALRKKSQDIVKNYVPEQDKTVESLLQEKESAAAVESIITDFAELRERSIVQPMMKAIRGLPKEEMAGMAEALVEITSLRRRVDSDVESVAGPVDVAVISKGDGLVWIKRKHYFDQKINTDFINRRSLRRNGDE